MKSKWLFILFFLMIKFKCWSQVNEGIDTIASTRDFYGFPTFEIPITIIPLSRGDLLFPIGSKENALPLLFTLGGNYLVYPHEKWKVGLLAGFSFGDYHRESFSGIYMFEEIEQKLRVDMITRFYSFRAGVKVINHTSNKRVKPFAEMYISRTSIKTWFDIDEQRRNEQTPGIEHGDVERDHTLVYHINAGLEFNLMNKRTLHNERYNGKGFFFSLGFGYAHGAQPVKHVDISQRVSSFEETLNSDRNFVRIESSETNFSTYVPRFESNIRLLNLSIAVVYRI